MAHQRANVKYCVKLDKSAVKTYFDMIRQVRGDAAVNRSRCFKWCVSFEKHRWKTARDQERPLMSLISQNVETNQQYMMIVREQSTTLLTLSACHTEQARRSSGVI